MTQISPAPTMAPSTLPPVPCAAWCVDGTGHTDARFPEDQVCRGTTVDVELTRRPMVEVADGVWQHETIHLYLLRQPGAHTPEIQIYRGDLGESVALSVDEAEALGLSLVKSALEARDCR